MHHLAVRNGRLIACLLACLSMSLAAHAESASDPGRDFLYLELQQSLSKEPDSPKNPARFFALGEYQFGMKNFAAAERFFRKADEKASGELALFTKVYLARLAPYRSADDGAQARHLKETLASRHFLSTFGKKKQETWTSILKNRYTLVEHVDRLEVYLNDKLLYTISLP